MNNRLSEYDNDSGSLILYSFSKNLISISISKPNIKFSITT